MIAADFFVVPTATYRLLFVLVLLAHDRRRIVDLAVTDHPTAAWTVQQLRDAFPWNEAPRYLIRDRDHAFDGVHTSAEAMGIHEVLTSLRSHPRSDANLELSDSPTPPPLASQFFCVSDGKHLRDSPRTCVSRIGIECL